MYKLNDEKMFYDIADGVAIVIDFTTGMYYGMSSLGSAVLDRLLAGSEADQILSVLKELPDCPDDIEAKMQVFIEDLLKRDILIRGGVNSGEPQPFDPQSLADGFDLHVDEFAEVQDLIMADPIHEVDVEQGWPFIKEQ